MAWLTPHSTDTSLTVRENIDETGRSRDWATVKKRVLTECHVSTVNAYKSNLKQCPKRLCLFTVSSVNMAGEATDKILMTSVISVCLFVCHALCYQPQFTPISLVTNQTPSPKLEVHLWKKWSRHTTTDELGQTLTRLLSSHQAKCCVTIHLQFNLLNSRLCANYTICSGRTSSPSSVLERIWMWQ